MSTIGAICHSQLYPERFTLIQKVASELTRVNPDVQKIMSFFSEHCIFSFLKRSGFREFFVDSFVNVNASSIQLVGSWKDEYQPCPNENNRFLWESDGFQYCSGSGLRETEKGWYHLRQRVLITVVNVGSEEKISRFCIITYVKSKLPTDQPIQQLPSSFYLVHEFAMRIFEIPRQNEALLDLYHPHAVIIYPTGDIVGKLELDKKLKSSVGPNFSVIGAWKNTYLPILNMMDKVIGVKWVSEGLLKCYEKEGERWFRMLQIVDFFFQEHIGSPKIAKQVYFTFKKTRLSV